MILDIYISWNFPVLSQLVRYMVLEECGLSKMNGIDSEACDGIFFFLNMKQSCIFLILDEVDEILHDHGLSFSSTYYLFVLFFFF